MLQPEVSSAYSEAITALESLGFTRVESREAVERVLTDPDSTDEVAEIIENALKYLST